MAPWCNRLGLILGLVGSLMITFAVGKPPSEVYQLDEHGKKVGFATFRRPRLLRWGVPLLAVGFALAFVSTFLPP